MTKKLCPMKFADTNGATWSPAEPDTNGSTYPTCDEDKCAWWDSNSRKCAMRSIAHWVREIGSGGER